MGGRGGREGEGGAGRGGGGGSVWGEGREEVASRAPAPRPHNGGRSRAPAGTARAPAGNSTPARPPGPAPPRPAPARPGESQRPLRGKDSEFARSRRCSPASPAHRQGLTALAHHLPTRKENRSGSSTPTWQCHCAGVVAAEAARAPQRALQKPTVTTTASRRPTCTDVTLAR